MGLGAGWLSGHGDEAQVPVCPPLAFLSSVLSRPVRPAGTVSPPVVRAGGLFIAPSVPCVSVLFFFFWGGSVPPSPASLPPALSAQSAKQGNRCGRHL